ncbi:MAG TPA: primosomal protein N' (replication factor Y) - superfamily II helicase, partial [Epsilonproteobacteria bacterium]|nr:primosomal protein N' (replication factor Y) - superfamily II helicase [Campylobacterota bacterium]
MKFTAINFSCPNCGAPQKFSPATDSMVCDFCGTSTPIKILNTPIKEYNFHNAMESLSMQIAYENSKKISCQKCGASFELDEDTLATSCPYCGTPAITDFTREITPKSLIPFRITKEQAKEQFYKWTKSKWLAPKGFHLHLENNKNIQGYYLPYWTYDTQTTTQYQGMRGDI